jgi:signal transduction histidine kinase
VAHLGAGKHRFEVRAMDRNWNEDPGSASAELAIVIPWYEESRIIVTLVCGLALVLFFAGLAVNRHLQLIRSYAEVEKIVALRTQELERANQELLHSQKMRALGTLAAGIAHDFNNILSIIKGSAQIIEGHIDDEEKIRTRVNRIKTVVEQGAGIVKSMLGLSRISPQNMVLCDLNSIVEDTIKLLDDRFLHEVTIQFQAAPALPAVPAVKELIQQMLLNLILNAADAMSGIGEVKLATGQMIQLPPNLALSPTEATNHLYVAVQDTGCGIAQEILPRIFEPFFTTKAFSTRRGTGLGLSMVYQLAKELGFGLKVQSSIGKGSTFTIIIPINRSF